MTDSFTSPAISGSTRISSIFLVSIHFVPCGSRPFFSRRRHRIGASLENNPLE
jgi:hypothetical protein